MIFKRLEIKILACYDSLINTVKIPFTMLWRIILANPLTLSATDFTN